MIKTAKLPQERFTTQGGRTHGDRRVGKIFIILNLFILKIRRFFRIFGYGG